MAMIFDTMLAKGVRSGHIPALTQNARDWYRKTAQQHTNINEDSFLKTADRERFSNTVKIGNMYMFRYNAKYKETLPYWDVMPLVFPFKKVQGGFLGLNMHYLPLPHRAKLMDALYDITNNKAFDETTKLKLNYNLLNGASKYRYFTPTVKHYLTDHMVSRFLYIYPAEWDMALFLPLERFQTNGKRISKEKVWAESKKNYN